MGITHTYYKRTQSNRLKKNGYTYTSTYINIQSNFCNSNVYIYMAHRKCNECSNHSRNKVIIAIITLAGPYVT